MKSNSSGRRLANQIKVYGAPPPLCFDTGESPELINYLDLVTKRKHTHLPNAVVEFQSRPILYIVENDRLSVAPSTRKKELLSIKQMLANRGDIAYIGVLRPGQLEVYPIDLKKSLSGKIQILEKDKGSHTFFQSLAFGTFKVKRHSNPDYVYNRIFKLLDISSKHLISSPCNLPPEDVLSLIGRALFFRFLKDRNIIIDADLKEICHQAKRFEDCFSNPAKTALTSAWLDRTFNGDLLPLPSGGSLKYFRDVGEQTKGVLFKHLSAIIFGAEPAGHDYQLHLWKDFDFSHIPVGLLSQVYESFSNKWDPYSRKTSIYYTPRSIADYLVDEAFFPVKEPSKAIVLDPAVGAGIFLVLAFKRLVAETWKADGIRPDSRKIQKILYNQLSGFDINESALKLAALSLYLTAIELDANPRPPHKLKFPEPLREKVLFYYRKDTEPHDGPVIGSLGDHVDSMHNGRYDMVIGNPPWTKLGEEYSALADQYTQVVRKVAKNRGLDDVAKSYANPDSNPDLPFVWKAMEWTKPGGTLALTLPARILFKQSSNGRKAREALFQSVKITGILNCSNLSDTKVWPKMNQHFCLFFAKNSIPDDGSQFHFSTPYLESDLNSKGRLRIDFSAANPLQIKRVKREPWLLKTLTIGTSLDVGVLRKIIGKNEITIKKYWEKNDLKHSRGYEVIKKKKQYDASAMKKYPDLNKEISSSFFFYLNTKKLPLFDEDTLSKPGDIKCYHGPLVLLRKSPGDDLNNGKTLLCLDKVVYNESFYGYSGNGHKDGEELVRYLYLIAYSSLFKFYILTTSAEFGLERRVFQKGDFDEFPIIPIENLKTEDRKKIWSLSEKIAHDELKPFSEIDKLICRIYGLDTADFEVIKDTIEVGLPFKRSRKAAEAPPTKTQKDEFIKDLKNQLLPFFKTVNQTIYADIIKLDSSDLEQPWLFIKLSTKKSAPPNIFKSIDSLMAVANESGASQIIIKDSDGLIVGLLNQYRYWTKSRARLCGLEILHQHMDSFSLQEVV